MNEALDKMARQVGQGPNKLKVLSAMRLRNCSIVYEFDSPKMATWLHKEKDRFAASFGGTSVVKDKSVPVLIEFVPTTHNPDALAENRKIEHDSRIEANSLQSTRWIKPVQRRAARQRMAHLIARFNSASVANQAICDGMVIAGKRVWARWL